MSRPKLEPASPGQGLRRAGWTLAGLALLLAGLAGTAPASAAGNVTARLGSITVSATALRPGPAGTLTAFVAHDTIAPPQ